MVIKMLTISGIYESAMFEPRHEMHGMPAIGTDVRKVITHRLPAKEFDDGSEVASSGSAGRVFLAYVRGEP